MSQKFENKCTENQRVLAKVWCLSFGCTLNDDDTITDDDGKKVADFLGCEMNGMNLTFKARLVEPLKYVKVEGEIKI